MSNAVLEDAKSWSKNEFSGAELGNKKRVNRLVLIGKRMAEGAAGTIAEIFKTSAERQGAYKFVENPKIKATGISKAAHLACARRCTGESFVFVPVDGSTLSIADAAKLKNLGPTGPKGTGSGLEAMSAIAVRSDGTALGICGQSFWARKKGPTIKHTRKKRTMAEKETRHWLDVIGQTEQAFSEAAPDCKPWYQLDRGADFREMLIWSAQANSLVTVRCTQDRLIEDPESRKLWEGVEKQTKIGNYKLKVTAGKKRKARLAQMAVRTRKVTFTLFDEMQNKKVTVELTAVHVREEKTVPAGEKAIEWLLLTNAQVVDFSDACMVIYGYSQRWKIEEFHKAWKSVCGVEKIQLRDFSNIEKMAILLASVAMRVERLKFLARNSPELPATVELTQNEINTLIILQNPKGYKPGDVPTIGTAVGWIADLGGYTGKSSGGPPGTITIGRGLSRLQQATKALEAAARWDAKKTD